MLKKLFKLLGYRNPKGIDDYSYSVRFISNKLLTIIYLLIVLVIVNIIK